VAGTHTLVRLALRSLGFGRWRYLYHDRKAIRKPNQEKKKVRPYLLMGLRMGMDRAFLLIGLVSGALHNWETAKGMSAVVIEL
jgi:hypothetical protein